MRKTVQPCRMLVLCLFVSCFLNATSDEPQKNTEISINGIKTTVFFNDGDTFKIIDGKFKNKRVRIAGFNAPESYGPVHEWEGNSPVEIYEIANRATDAVRNGSWSCVLEKEKDSYGRLLATCDDLAIALIEKGLAHAYSVDENDAKKTYLESQTQAQKDKIGMWRDGVPEYIITSLHSANEREQASGDKEQATYNRLINTKTGATKKMYHHNNYATCEKVCLENEKSCMIHVPYHDRYGSKRPGCLKTGK